MIVDIIRTASFLNISRVRRLPYPGQVLVEVGMDLAPGDLIAEAQIQSQVITLDIAKGLGISPEETKTCLIHEVDETLEEGDVIAQYEKTLPRLFRAPIDGKIISYHKGKMALATKTAKIALHANMLGKVEEVIPEYGVKISAQGGLIQGMWGNGHADSGILAVVDKAFDKPLEVSLLNEISSDMVFAGGVCFDEAFLEECKAKEILGLILVAASPDLIPTLKTLPFPVILLQGFDELPLAEDIVDILQTNNGELVSVNACQRDIYKGERPEVIIPKEEGDFERTLGFRKLLEVGDRVRILSGKAIYQAGKVVEILETGQVYENGLILPTALVKLKSLEKIKVPQQNLLVIG